MSGLLNIILLTLFVCTFVSYTPAQCEEQTCAEVVVSSAIRPYLDASDALMRNLSIKANEIVLSSEQGNSHVIAVLKASRCRYVIAVGYKAYSLVERVSGKERFYTMVLYPQKSRLFSCGLSLDITCGVLKRALEGIGNSGSIGVALLFSQKELEPYVIKLSKCMKNEGIKAEPVRVSVEKPLADLARRVGRYRVIVALPDSIFSSEDVLEGVCELAAAHGVKLVGFNQLFLKRGAYAALLLDYGKVGALTARIINRYMKNGICTTEDPPYRLVLNPSMRGEVHE